MQEKTGHIRHKRFNVQLLSGMMKVWKIMNVYKRQAIDSTQPSIPPGSVNEYQLRLGKQRQVWFIPLPDERGVCR